MNRNVYATILIVLAIGIYFTVTKSILTQASDIRESNAKYTEAIKSAKDLISLREKILADWTKLSPEDQTRLDKMVPKSVDNIRLIIDLNDIALKRGFSLKDIKASTVAVDKSASASQPQLGPTGAQNIISTSVPDRVTVTFGVSASYKEFRSFLEDLEASLRILDLTHLSLSVNAKDEGIYDWKVELQTYWLRSQ